MHILPDDLDEAVGKYLDEYMKEVQDMLDHPDDPDKWTIGGLSSRMFFEGITRWPNTWRAREKAIREERYGGPTWGPPACGCWTHHEGDC